MKKYLYTLFLLTVICFISSCVSIEKRAPLINESLTGNKFKKLNAGRELYIGKCAKCHSVEPIYKYSSEDWLNDILPKMNKKTKLNSLEASQLKAYVIKALNLSKNNQIN